MKLDFFDQILTEVAGAPARTPHPEDSIFEGSAAADKMLKALEFVLANPSTVTIKWDGIPALVFGRNVDGQLVVADKYMFDVKDGSGRVTNPEAWVEYDRRRGANRGDLYQRIATIWPGLEQVVGTTPGYFWGDLLWAGKLKPTAGSYVFKPNIVQYSVPVKSPLGQRISQTNGGIVVHSYIANETAKPVPWNGTGLNLNADVTILTPSAGIGFKLKDPVQLHRAAATAIKQYSTLIDRFLAGLDGVAKQAIKTYMNKKITGQTQEPLLEWLAQNVSGAQYRKLVGDNQGGYLHREQKGLTALFAVWNAMYAFKENLTQQLEQQVKGFSQSIQGQPQGEGFVFSTDQGPIKLVQRSTFGRALFNK